MNPLKLPNSRWHLILSHFHGLAFIVLFPILTRAGIKEVPGYILSLHNDTIYGILAINTDVFGNLNEARLSHTIELPDSIGNFENLTPDDINGFGFAFNSRQYTFVSKPVDSSGRLLFVQPVILGPKAALYCGVQLYYRLTEDLFFLQKEDGTYTCLSSIMPPDEFRAKLKEFFKDDQDVTVLADACFRRHRRTDIQQDVARVIRQANTQKEPPVVTQQ